MTLATHHIPIPFPRRVTGLEHACARLQRLYLRWGTARLNRALAIELTDQQLADAGLHRTDLNGKAPITQVSARVMVKLMSMR